MLKKWMLPLVGFSLSSVSLFADEAPIGREQNMWQTATMVGIAIIFFYFILWRPEQKRRKMLEAQRNSMNKGDKVVAMGILGTVSQIKENTVILKMCDGSKIEVLKGAITDVTPAADVEIAEVGEK